MPNLADLAAAKRKAAARKTTTPYTPPSPYKSSTALTPTTSTGRWVQDQTAGPGGTSMSVRSNNNWMAPTSGVRVNPGNDALAAAQEIFASGSDPGWIGQTIGSLRDGRSPSPTSSPTSGWPTSGGGSGGGGYGGGGGYSGPMLDDATFRAIIDRIRATRPDALQFQALDLPDYEAPEFYDFDRSQYDRMRAELPQAISRDRARGMGGYDDARAEISDYSNPYASGSSSLDPGVSAAMERMFAANSADTAPLAELNWLAQQSNDAMQTTHGMLAGAADQRQAGNLRALEGDRRRYNEMLDSEGRNINLGIEMALANALTGYNQNRFAYDADNSRYSHGVGMQEAMQNFTRQNQVSDANVTNQNTYRSSTLQPIIDAILGGLHNGQNKLDLSYLEG